MATRGRPKRIRSRKAGNAVAVKPHSRTPRGPNFLPNGKKKPPVRVAKYRRGKPAS